MGAPSHLRENRVIIGVSKVTKTPTAYDVAAHAGVSTATVSRVFGRPGDVRPQTRDRVLASVRELGYVPSASARGLALRRTGVLGLYLPGFDALEEPTDIELETDGSVTLVADMVDPAAVNLPNLYFDEVLRGGALEARRHGFALLVAVGQDASPQEMVNDIAGRVDGLAVIAGSLPLELLEHVSRRIPIVLIAGSRQGDDFDHVTVSNTEGMRALTEHLIVRHGADEPAYLAGPEDSPDNVERYRGFVDALVRHGLDARGTAIDGAGFSRIRARAVAEDLIEEGRLPKVLVCGNDQMALGVLDVCIRRGLRVPGDVIVTGFDGIDAGRQSRPPLTTVYQPILELGRMAMRTMLSRMDDPERPPKSVRLPVQVLLRESSEGESRCLDPLQ
jgi:LacI family transcriptional regulator